MAVALGALLFYFGMLVGIRKGYRQRMEDMRKNVNRTLEQAQADLDVLNKPGPPRQRVAHIKGTSRRATE
jgi:hypothetical protein